MISAAEIYEYDLPEDRIAQRPAVPCDSARLLRLTRGDAGLSESVFSALPAVLGAGDLLVFNNTKVVPARFLGRLDSGAAAELLTVSKAPDDTWECMGKPLKKFKPGVRIRFGDGLSAEIAERSGESTVRVRFIARDGSTEEAMSGAGVMPIPPYIRAGLGDERDRTDYQTFFAEHPGSVAAPTASLHFTPELVETLKDRGCDAAFLTLHVGPASFQPLWNEGQSKEEVRRPQAERLVFSPALMQKVREAKNAGRRVIAVGTTVVRALESMMRMEESGNHSGSTELFITPGFEFKAVDAIITNFHQPRSTHLLLIQAFIGRELLDKSYKYALDNGFRFLSYGDGMLIE